MAGKSTLMRQVALSALMAHMGSFVPAKEATIGLCDRIFTRVGASDNLGRGQSTFMVEMVETASILRDATEASLVLLDEVGRGTSTFDGVSIAWAVAEAIHDSVRCRTLFATHYHELTELAASYPRIFNVHVAVAEQGGSVVFLRHLREGPASRSYGVHVARLAGLPESVLTRAEQLLAALEHGAQNHEARGATIRRQVNQLSLFHESVATKNGELVGTPSRVEHLEAELGKIDVMNLTPIQALTELHRLKKMLESSLP